MGWTDALMLLVVPGHKGLHGLPGLWAEVVDAFVGSALAELRMRILGDHHRVAFNHVLEAGAGPER